eukprot:3011537-Prymnesium_polylepis.3
MTTYYDLHDAKDALATYGRGASRGGDAPHTRERTRARSRAHTLASPRRRKRRFPPLPAEHTPPPSAVCVCRATAARPLRHARRLPRHVRSRARGVFAALAISTTMANVRYHLPCTVATAPFLGCDPRGAACEPCPLERPFVGVGCCVTTDRPMSSMGGDFYRLPGSPMLMEGGHAM